MNTRSEIQDPPHHVVREIAARATLAVGLASIAVIHLIDSIGKYHETPYLFWMYVALMTGSSILAGLALFTRSRSVFLAGAALAASAAAGYVLSRTTGLPSASDDIGNWTEPLGLASLFVEGGVAAIGLTAFLTTRPARDRRPGRRPQAQAA